MYLLDTDWMIQALGNRQPALRVLQQLESSRVHVSYVSLGELYEHAYNSVHPEAHLLSFRVFLYPYHLLGLTHSIMRRFAELRAYLRRRGQLIPNFDLLLAATALRYGLTLLTFNRRHFERIPDLQLHQLS